MKRILTNCRTQLVAALFLLMAIAALYAWVADHLPARPRIALQLNDNLLMWMTIFSPDGKLLLTINSRNYAVAEKCELVLWDLETGMRRWSTVVDRIDNLGENLGVEFSPDGKLLAAKSKGYDLKIWDTSDGTLRLEKVLEHNHLGGLPGDDFVETRFSPDGRYLLFEKYPRTDVLQIIFWDIATNQEWTRIKGSYSSLRFTPDGKRLAVIQDRNVALWEMPGGASLPRLLKQQRIVEGVFAFNGFTLSPDLQTYATVLCIPDSPSAYEIELWDLATGEEKSRSVYRDAEPNSLHSLEFSSNGRFLMATFVTGKYVTWNAQGELQAVHFFQDIPLVSPCGRWTLLRDTDGTNVWETGTLRKHVDLRRQADHDPGLSIGFTGLPPWTNPPAAKYQFSSDGHFVMVTGFQTTTMPNLMEMVFTGQWSRLHFP